MKKKPTAETMKDTLATAQPELEKLRAEVCGGGELYAAILPYIEKSLRAIEQFESGIEVIVCIGMLKAGKSTLVNLLTRSREASPMGYGQDTTLRPVIIRMAEPGQEGQVVIYDTAAGDEGRAEHVQQVMDYLRGLPGRKTARGLQVRELPLSADVLTAALCTRPSPENKLLPQEPVMVVVETEYEPDCVLLKDRNRMILDMPGCDSPNAAIVQNNLYREIGKECDMALILQSSVAPLNEKAVELLRNLLGRRSASTFRIIQNRMEAKLWLQPEVLEAQNEAQKKSARRVFSVLSGNRALRVDSVNLGLAYAGIFEGGERLRLPVPMPAGVLESREALRAASGFCELEAELAEALPGIRLAHCRDEWQNSLQELAGAVDALAGQVVERLASLSAESEQLRSFGRRAAALLVPAELPAGASFRFAGNAELPDFEQIASRTCNSWNNGRLGREEVTGRDVNECLEACSAACQNALEDYVRCGVKLCHLQLELAGQCEPLDRYCDDVLVRNALDAAAEMLDAELHDMFARFPKAVHPRHSISLREQPVRLPLPADFHVEPCQYERMRETERLWEKLPINVSKTYLSILSNSMFRKRLVAIASYYRASLERLLMQYPPYKSVQELMQKAATRATAPLHQAISNALHHNRASRESLEEEAKTLQNMAQTIFTITLPDEHNR